MPYETPEHPFISFLEKNASDRALLADLRRGLGSNRIVLYRYITPFISAAQDDGMAAREADLLLIGGLFGLHPVSTRTGNMGDHLRALAQDVGDDTATTRRFVQLLNLRRPTLDVPLRQHISLLKAKEIPVNWQQLLADLRRWDAPSRAVQKQWARAYWRSDAKKP